MFGAMAGGSGGGGGAPKPSATPSSATSGSGPAPFKSRDLRKWLAWQNLEKYAAELREIGVESAFDLLEVEDRDFADVGMKLVERRRIDRIKQELINIEAGSAQDVKWG